MSTRIARTAFYNLKTVSKTILNFENSVQIETAIKSRTWAKRIEKNCPADIETKKNFLTNLKTAIAVPSLQVTITACCCAGI
jgi:hypothetical protein